MDLHIHDSITNTNTNTNTNTTTITTITNQTNQMLECELVDYVISKHKIGMNNSMNDCDCEGGCEGVHGDIHEYCEFVYKHIHKL